MKRLIGLVVLLVLLGIVGLAGYASLADWSPHRQEVVQDVVIPLQ